MLIQPKDVRVVIINWRELETTLASLDALQNEPYVREVVVFDNGSGDDEVQTLVDFCPDCQGDVSTPVYVLSSPTNVGISRARNTGALELKHTDSDLSKYTFFIDGDIVYVPGTIGLYRQILISNENTVCVGHNNLERVQQTGINGVRDKSLADRTCPLSGYYVIKDYPMAWTQYGLFSTEFLKTYPFVHNYPFDRPGHGYEDDYMFSQIEEAGKHCLGVSVPTYYHDANRGLRNLEEDNTPTLGEERREAYFNKWGHYGFVHRLRTGQHNTHLLYEVE